MLDEFGPWLTEAKAKDLVRRLDNKNPDQAIPAEYELSLGWAISQVAEVTVEPTFGTSAPDFLAEGLLPGSSAVVEVAALSDWSLSGGEAMNRTANIINTYSNSVRKGASRHLYFKFLESSGYTSPIEISPGVWKRGEYYRRRLTSRKFELAEEHRSLLRSWLMDWPPPTPLKISGEGTELEIAWREYVHPASKVFSSMPSLTYSLTDNPLYERLKEKERRQLRRVPAGATRCFFLGDAGCQLLRVPLERDPTRRVVSGRDIIAHFLQNSSVDLIAVFSPRRRDENGWDHKSNPRIWHLDVYDMQGGQREARAKLIKVAGLLPAPRLHGYQAYSWVQQDMLNPQGRGQYRPLIYGSGGKDVSAKISARALLEMMAGRMSAGEMQTWITGDDNVFEYWLQKGFAISEVSFEPLGPDQDDDYVVFRFSTDSNASPLRLPPILSSQG